MLQPLSSKVLNAVNRAIYIYFGFLTKTIIIGYYTVFHGLINLHGYNLSSFCKKQKYIHQSKNKTIYKVTRHVQSKSQTYCLNKRFSISYHFTVSFSSDGNVIIID